MATKFNPFIGNLDFTGAGSTQNPNYQNTFNATTDWGSPSGGFYSLSIPNAAHGKGLNPVVQVYELNGTDYELVTVAVSIDSATGNVVIGVVESPDARFEGKIIIAENN